MIGDARGYGFRNPGGVGHTAQYYPPGNRFQNAGRAHRASRRMASIPRPSAAPHSSRPSAVGAYTSDVLYRHIDAYGSPRFVVGFFPFWGGGGFWP